MRYRIKLLSVLLAGGSLALLFGITAWKSQEPIQALLRPESGEGERKESLQVKIQGRKYPLELTLQELPYGEDELKERLQKALEGLEPLFLGENPDFKHVSSKLSMPSVYPGTEVSIQWYLDSWKYVEPDGTIKNEGLEAPKTVHVQAELALQGEKVIWGREIQVCPLLDLDIEQKVQMLGQKVEALQEEDETGKLRLPETVQGEPVEWYPGADDRWLWILLLTLLMLAGLSVGRREEEEKQRKKRERSMQLDYPDIVSRLSLYMGAGISTRKAWERIVDGYESKRAEKKGIRPAYEEMRTTLYEMRSGVPEAAAYERFGARCRMPAYLKLGILLSQNLRKGTKDLAGLLAEESREAFENRKALARKLGEECKSKLLLPMILLLMTVLIMVMYPAVASFQM